LGVNGFCPYEGPGEATADGEFDNAFKPAKALEMLLSYPVNWTFAMGEYVPTNPDGSFFGGGFFAGFFAGVDPVRVAEDVSFVVGPNDCADLGGFFKLPDLSRLHLNWQALGVLLLKWLAISFQPSFCWSFKCINKISSSASHEVGVLVKLFEFVDVRLDIVDVSPTSSAAISASVLLIFGLLCSLYALWYA
jgi:hypothetical protein